MMHYNRLRQQSARVAKTRAVLVKISAGFHGDWDIFPFPCNYCSRCTNQTVAQETLLSHSHPNRSRGKPPIPIQNIAVECLVSRGFPFLWRKIHQKYRKRGNLRLRAIRIARTVRQDHNTKITSRRRYPRTRLSRCRSSKPNALCSSYKSCA